MALATFQMHSGTLQALTTHFCRVCNVKFVMFGVSDLYTTSGRCKVKTRKANPFYITHSDYPLLLDFSGVRSLINVRRLISKLFTLKSSLMVGRLLNFKPF